MNVKLVARHSLNHVISNGTFAYIRENALINVTYVNDRLLKNPLFRFIVNFIQVIDHTNVPIAFDLSTNLEIYGSISKALINWN